eukprot:364981-Chlamydomonas_euryale.AAC.4
MSHIRTGAARKPRHFAVPRPLLAQRRRFKPQCGNWTTKPLRSLSHTLCVHAAQATLLCRDHCLRKGGGDGRCPDAGRRSHPACKEPGVRPQDAAAAAVLR